MGTLAIVAVPREDDYIWKISSEKVPHCTICFLGEAEGKPVNRIAAFVEHAVRTTAIGPFGLTVDYRGELGPDKADVLFFKKSWSGRRLEEFRGQLLQNNEIRDAYESVPQYDEWTPHLTLGYPETPAKEDKRDYPGFHWIEFDRIAVWTGNYEGPEFRLEYDYDDHLAEVAMSTSAERGRDFLEHFGVKGMKWGVRRSHTPVSITTKIAAGPRGKTKIKGKGGQAHPATEDALKAAEQKQKLRKSGAAALSNNELRELSTRMQLEQQVKSLDAQSRSSGKKLAKSLLKEEGNQAVGNIRRAGKKAAVRKIATGVAVAG